jgi:hypothetical protein
MTVQRLVWIVVAILLIAVAFTGGVAVATWSARRANFAGYSTAMMRGYGNNQMPNGRGVAPQFAPNQRRGVPPSNGRGNGMMPGYRNNQMPNGRGMTPQIAPNRPRVVPPGTGQGNQPGRGNNRFARPRNAQ